MVGWDPTNRRNSKRLQKENERLRKAVSDLTLDELILKEAHRSTERYQPRGREDEDRLAEDMIELAREYGGYSYRRVAVLLRDAGWQVGDGRIERPWKREGLRVPSKQPKKGRRSQAHLNDG